MTRLFAGTPFDIPPKCDFCDRLESECQCTAAEKAARETERRRAADRLPPEKQRARVRLENRKAGRKVTVIDGLSAKANDLPALLSQLQSACGAGGTVKESSVELQGDQVQAAQRCLASIGYRVS